MVLTMLLGPQPGWSVSIGANEVCTLVYVDVTVVEIVVVVNTIAEVETVDVVDASVGVNVRLAVEVIVVVCHI